MYKPPTSKSLPWLPCVPALATQVMTGWCCLNRTRRGHDGTRSATSVKSQQQSEDRVNVSMSLGVIVKMGFLLERSSVLGDKILWGASTNLNTYQESCDFYHWASSWVPSSHKWFVLMTRSSINRRSRSAA